MTTRRWYYLMPATGEPRALVHAIEPSTLDSLPGRKDLYAGREALATGLDGLVRGLSRVAMEYSPGERHPVPRSRRCRHSGVDPARGVDVVSSGDLVQRFEALWDADALATHVRRRRRSTGSRIARSRPSPSESRPARPTTEYDIQQLMVGWFEEEGLIADAPPVVAAMEHAGNPHYLPPPERQPVDRPRRAGAARFVGQAAEPGAVYADITWVGFTGSRVPEEFARAFDAIARGARRGHSPGAGGRQRRDDAARLGGGPRGPAGAGAAGYGAHVLHRTGHSLGEEVHGNGVHMDDYETHDDRRLLAGTGFTIEPGVYFDSLRRPHGNQHVRRYPGGARERPGAGSHRHAGVRRAAGSAALDTGAGIGEELAMSTRKTTVFYMALIAVASLAVGMVIASRLDLSPESSAQTTSPCRPPTAPISGPVDALTFRTIARSRLAGRGEHPDRVAPARAGADRVLRRRRHAAPLLRAAEEARTAATRRSRSRPAPASSSRRTASSSPTTTSSKARTRSRCRSTARTTTFATRRASSAATR